MSLLCGYVTAELGMGTLVILPKQINETISGSVIQHFKLWVDVASPPHCIFFFFFTKLFEVEKQKLIIVLPNWIFAGSIKCSSTCAHL